MKQLRITVLVWLALLASALAQSATMLPQPTRLFRQGAAPTADDKAWLRDLLAVRPGTDVQAFNPTLASIAANGVRPVNALYTGATGVGSAHDDVAGIEAALAIGDTFLPQTSGFYNLSRAIKVPGKRKLSAAPGAIIRRAAGTWAAGQAGLLENLTQTGGGDADITIEGGIWDGNGPAQTRVDTPFAPQAAFRFTKVTGLTIKDLTIKDPVMFSLLVGDARDLTITGIRFSQVDNLSNGDGVHLSGPLKNFTVRGISGKTGDDTVSVVTTDAPGSGFIYTQGIVEGGLIEDVSATTASNSCVRLLSGDGYALRGVTVRKLYGTFTGSGVLIGPFDRPGPDFSDILLDDIHITRSDANGATSYPVVQVDGSTRNLSITNSGRAPGDTTTVPFLTIVTGQTYGTISLSNYTETSNVDRDVVNLREDLSSLSLSDVTVTQTAGTATGEVVRTIEPTAGVSGRINFLNTTLTGMSGLMTVRAKDSLDLNIANHTQSGGYFVTRNLGALRLLASNVQATGLQLSAFGVGTSTGVCSQTINSARISATYGLADYYQSGAFAHRLVTSGCAGAAININPGGTGVTLSASGTDTTVDRTLLTPLNGDRVSDATGVCWSRVNGVWRPDAGSLTAVTSNAGTAIALTNADSGGTLYTTSGSAVTVTLPVSPVTGFTITVVQGGAGQVTMAPGGANSIVSVSGNLKISARYAAATACLVAPTVYSLTGSLAP